MTRNKVIYLPFNLDKTINYCDFRTYSPQRINRLLRGLTTNISLVEMRVFQKPHIPRSKDEQSLGQSVFVRIFFCSPYVVPVNGPLSLEPSVGNLSNNDDDGYENVT